MIFSTFSSLKVAGKEGLFFIFFPSKQQFVNSFFLQLGGLYRLSFVSASAELTLFVRCGHAPSSSSPFLLTSRACMWCSPVGLPYTQMGNALGKCFPLLFVVKCTEHFWMLWITNKYSCLSTTLGHKLWWLIIQYRYYLSDRWPGFAHQCIKPLRFGLTSTKIKSTADVKQCRARLYRL